MLTTCSYWPQRRSFAAVAKVAVIDLHYCLSLPGEMEAEGVGDGGRGCRRWRERLWEKEAGGVVDGGRGCGRWGERRLFVIANRLS